MCFRLPVHAGGFLRSWGAEQGGKDYPCDLARNMQCLIGMITKAPATLRIVNHCVRDSLRNAKKE